jgi:hypothetical protein
MVVASVIDAEVIEVLKHFGLAHARSADGNVYGLTRRTPCVEFDCLAVGQRVRCEVVQPFSRVVSAKVLGDLRSVRRARHSPLGVGTDRNFHGSVN